jgi:3'(2'), 5'-bisphosphate nucleotidase
VTARPEQDDAALAALAQTLIAPVQEAGREIMRVYRRTPEAEIKADGSPVTEADRAAEAILLPHIRAAAPDVQIVSEENPKSHRLKVTPCFFLVDPLDGTKEFLRVGGRGAFTVNIGLIEHGVPVMGLIFAPALDRLFYGSRNRGAFEMTAGTFRQIGVRRVDAADRIAVASASHRDVKTNQWLSAQNITNITAIGSSLKFCLIAAGEADAYPRYGPTMEWDTAAGDAILRAAGGTVLDEDGQPYRYGKPGYRNTPFFALAGGQRSAK